MAIEIYYRYCKSDKKGEYAIVAPFHEIKYLNYWTYWFWFYLGALTKGKSEINRKHILPFANTWDEDCKLIKTYKDTRDAEICAARVIKFILKH